MCGSSITSCIAVNRSLRSSANLRQIVRIQATWRRHLPAFTTDASSLKRTAMPGMLSCSKVRVGFSVRGVSMMPSSAFVRCSESKRLGSRPRELIESTYKAYRFARRTSPLRRRPTPSCNSCDSKVVP